MGTNAEGSYHSSLFFPRGLEKAVLKMKSFGGSSVCELCHHHQASFYCCSDSAFLCSHCDSQVHSANFLVARHICLSLSQSSSSSSSSSNNKAALNNKNIRRICDWKTRDVLVNWCRRLGLGVASGVEVTEVAIRALEASWGAVVWPYRLLLAASLWFGVMTTMFTKKDDDKKNKVRISLLLKRLQEISGVPPNSIMLAQSKLLLKMMKHHHHQHHHQQQQHHLEEGWDETS